MLTFLAIYTAIVIGIGVLSDLTGVTKEKPEIRLLALIFRLPMLALAIMVLMGV